MWDLLFVQWKTILLAITWLFIEFLPQMISIAEKDLKPRFAARTVVSGLSSSEKRAIQRRAAKPSPWATLNIALSGAHHAWWVLESSNVFCWESGVPLEPIALKEYAGQHKSHWRSKCKISHGFCVPYLVLSRGYGWTPSPTSRQGARFPLPYTEKNKVSVGAGAIGNDWKSFIPKVTQKS